eukprot:TRINITY_DN10690_c0_g1_i1.p1 TRINITY_DN10690_c0_g1~~TRINITY_DN10690_c0_g1_i1.p1  ORF type:complete len:202 (+),score=60.51 TRINITY_DN10690_c0_g1_i1:437-1042(+)
MFSQVRELIADEQALVMILIDEVESLAAARKAAANGTEPSDAIRVVNALLTQIDQLSVFPNVMVLTTSNLTGAIDVAFVDRADLKIYLGPPSLPARYSILTASLQELARKGIVQPEGLLEYKVLEAMKFRPGPSTKASLGLLEVCSACEGLSARIIKKLPLLAHAFQLQRASLVSMEKFLQALLVAVQRELRDRSQLTNSV